MGLRTEVLQRRGKPTVYTGQPGVGNGKLTGLIAVEQALRNPEINPEGIEIVRLDPSKSRLSTQLQWAAVRRIMYERSADEKRQESNRKIREGSQGPVMRRVMDISLASLNHELRSALSRAARAGDPFVFASAHGMYGPQDSMFFEIDAVAPERYAVGRKLIFAPTPEVRDAYVEDLHHPAEQIATTGHILPEELVDADGRARGRERRITMFSREEPTTENPLRIAFMMTGQLAHMQDLRTLLSDEMIGEWVKEGKAKIDVYLWNGKRQAQEIKQYAQTLGLDPQMTTQYDPDFQTGVQLFWNKDPDTAVEKKFAMAGRADYLIAPPAEYVGWFAAIPGDVLAPIGGNRKMETNREWLSAQHLIDEEPGTFGQKIKRLFSTDGAPIESFYRESDRIAREVGLDGAKKIARRVLAQVGAS